MGGEVHRTLVNGVVVDSVIGHFEPNRPSPIRRRREARISSHCYFSLLPLFGTARAVS
jgi:hypothetical protein